MENLTTMFNGLARSFTIKKKKICVGNSGGRKVAEAMTNDAEKNELLLRTSGIVNLDRSMSFASVFSKRGENGANQDSCVDWEEFGCQKDMMFCGIFDGYGQWGHFVSKRVRKSLPYSMLCNWREALFEASHDRPDCKTKSDELLTSFNVWKQSYTRACAAVDQELKHQRKFDSFNSGTTSLTIFRQEETIYISNVGDSRVVLATTSEHGILNSVQLTTDFKPNLPEEVERLIHRKGQVFCMDDEPGVHMMWLPDEESPGLSMFRSFGDFCVKDFGLNSVPKVTERRIMSNDRFVVLATDGV